MKQIMLLTALAVGATLSLCAAPAQAQRYGIERDYPLGHYGWNGVNWRGYDPSHTYTYSGHQNGRYGYPGAHGELGAFGPRYYFGRGFWSYRRPYLYDPVYDRWW